VYVVLEGRVAITLRGATVERVGPGGVFGELAVVDQTTRAANAAAEIDCVLLAINRPVLINLMKTNPDFGVSLLTAVAVRDGPAIRWGHAESRVTFRELTPQEIAGYVAGGEPLGRAGAYAIQGAAGDFVTRLEGDFDTVVGLPVELVRRLLPSRLGGRIAG